MFRDLFSSKNSPVNLDAEIFEKQLKDDINALLIDVRTTGENKGARIPGSVLIDISRPDFIDEIEKLDRNKSYYVYCHSGSRSYHASKKMKQMGFENVYNLAEGIISWEGELEYSKKAR
ncbi:MAG: rhodanese-like domain-containing protein [bacterium]